MLHRLKHVHRPPETKQGHSFDGFIVEASTPFFTVFFVTVGSHLHLILIGCQTIVLVNTVRVKGWGDALGVEGLLGPGSTPQNGRHLFDVMEILVRIQLFSHQFLNLFLIDIGNIIVFIFHFCVPFFDCSLMF